MNENLKNKLEEYRWLQAPYLDYPIVDCTDFFDGNNVYGSFAANACRPDYDVNEFRAAFLSLLERDDVQRVWICLYSFEDDEPDWPYADAAYVATTLSAEFLNDHFGDGFPSEVTVVVPDPIFGDLPDGFVLYCLAWD